MIVFLDMDGVLSDFDTPIIDKFGSKKEWNDGWDKLNPDFFYTLPKKPDADELVDYVRGLFDVHVLTAIPKKGKFDAARVQKFKWCFDNFKIYPSKIHVCFREEKQFYAAEDNLSPNVLIDDLEKNCSEFKAKGGIAIHHTSTKNSIQELQQLGF
tara:strand:- start:2267 stop:2731 length:465 start_codon:yes stop_codon:yes gene_type:complete